MKTFVSYARDLEGAAYAEWLVERLRSASLDVSWDGDLTNFNPSSIQEWMEDQVHSSIVICVVTQEYAERFGRGSNSPRRKGVLYESRAIEQRLHDHTASGACPVIPVIPDGLSADKLPSPLRRLLATKISLENKSGIDELLTRIRALSHTAGVMMKTADPRGSVAATPVSDPEESVYESALRDLLARLEVAEPGTPSALSAVTEWLDLGEVRFQTIPPLYAQGFPDAEKIAKTAGDLDFMRRISDACLKAIRNSEPPLRADVGLEARILVCGEGWYFQRNHDLQAALDSTRLGVALAARVGQRRTEAFGKKCLGRLERLVGEEECDSTVAQSRFEQSIALLEDAREMFFGIDGPGSEEAGDCSSLESRAWLAYYRSSGSAEFLSKAKSYAEQAEELIPPRNSKDYWDLVILNAELELEYRHYSKASLLVQEAIDRLRESSDAPRSEILARAYCVRAAIDEKRHARASSNQALRDLEEAERIYRRLGQEHAALECHWRQIVIHPAKVTNLQLSRSELEELARRERDPKLRIEAIRELDAEEKARIGISIGHRVKKVDWAVILRRAQQGISRWDS